jgi:hypothetical protein
MKILSLIILLFLISCTDYKTKRKNIVTEKIIEINNDIIKWKKLNQEILNDQIVNKELRHTIKRTQLNSHLQTKLEEFEISSFVVYKSEDCDRIEYRTDWSEYPIGSLYLNWHECADFQTKKGYYLDNFDENFIEVWGVGNNFEITIDSDFI